MDVATGHWSPDIGTAKNKRQMEMAVQRNKTESNGETACDETEKSEGLSGMPKIEAIESIISKPSPTSWLGTIKSCRDKDVRRNLIHFASKTRMARK